MQRSILAYAAVGCLVVGALVVPDFPDAPAGLPMPAADPVAAATAVAHLGDEPESRRAPRPAVADGIGIQVRGFVPDGAELRVIVAAVPATRTGAPDIDALLAMGEAFACDAAGRTRVPRPERTAIVGCLQGERFGLATIGAASTDLEIQLRTDHSVEVVVTDIAGEPAANVPVALRVNLGSTHLDALVRRTDVGGRVVLRHLANYMLQGGAGDGPRDIYTIALACPLLTPVSRPIDPTSPPAGPIRLTMPETGSVTVKLLDAGGHVCRQPGVVELHVVAAAPESPTPPAAVQAIGPGHAVPLYNGRATIPHVELGLQILVVARTGTPPEEQSKLSSRYAGRGPTRVGEHQPVTLKFRMADVEFAGRILDASGAPVAETSLAYRFLAPMAHSATMAEGELRTDADGRFQVMFPGARRQFTERLVIRDATATAEFAIDPKRPGTRIELGTTKMR